MAVRRGDGGNAPAAAVAARQRQRALGAVQRDQVAILRWVAPGISEAQAMRFGQWLANGPSSRRQLVRAVR